MKNKVKIIVKDGKEYEVTDLSSLKKRKTGRGFGIYEFKDKHGIQCSLQDSSLATESAIWFGVDDVEPIIMGKQGWENYHIPEEVVLHNRMHLTQEQVKKLLPILQYFADTGEYVRDFEEDVN